MAFELPLRTLPRNPFQQALLDNNAYRKSDYENEIKRVESEFAPLTVPAKAMSELAYSSAVGPQFAAKLAQDIGAMSNLTQPQREKLISYVYNSTQPGGGNVGTGMNLFKQITDSYNANQQGSQINNPFLRNARDFSNSPMNFLRNIIGGLFGGNNSGNQVTNIPN